MDSTLVNEMARGPTPTVTREPGDLKTDRIEKAKASIFKVSNSILRPATKLLEFSKLLRCKD